MEIALDLMADLRRRTGRPALTEPGHAQALPADQTLDWPGLHARCIAGHVARRALAISGQPGPVARGGFDRWAASAAGGVADPVADTLRRVNLTALGDGKLPAGMVGGVATDPMFADEKRND